MTRSPDGYQPGDFENVGPQWSRDEPWQTQQAGIWVRGFTDPSPWMRHQRRLFIGAMAAFVSLLVAATAVSVMFG